MRVGRRPKLGSELLPMYDISTPWNCRWHYWSPITHLRSEGILQLDTSTLLEPISADDAHALSIRELPLAIRITADRKAAITREWSIAFGNYSERLRAMTLYYHRDHHLMITAAEMKAAIDPAVIEASECSLRLKEQIVAFENSERQLEAELKVKLAQLSE